MTHLTGSWLTILKTRENKWDERENCKNAHSKVLFRKTSNSALSLSENRNTLTHATIMILSRRFRTKVITRYFDIFLARLFSENTHYFVREFSILNKNWEKMVPLVYWAKISKWKYSTLGHSLTVHRREVCQCYIQYYYNSTSRTATLSSPFEHVCPRKTRTRQNVATFEFRLSYVIQEFQCLKSCRGKFFRIK